MFMILWGNGNSGEWDGKRERDLIWSFKPFPRRYVRIEYLIVGLWGEGGGKPEGPGEERRSSGDFEDQLWMLYNFSSWVAISRSFFDNLTYLLWQGMAFVIHVGDHHSGIPMMSPEVHSHLSDWVWGPWSWKYGAVSRPTVPAHWPQLAGWSLSPGAVSLCQKLNVFVTALTIVHSPVWRGNVVYNSVLLVIFFAASSDFSLLVESNSLHLFHDNNLTYILTLITFIYLFILKFF